MGYLVETSDRAVALGGKWYVAETKPFPLSWVQAERELRRQEFSFFNPKVIQRQGACARRDRRLLYIPGYIFIKFNLDDRWQAINSTPGIKSLMMFKSSEKPIPIESVVIERLMALCDYVEDKNGKKDWFVRLKQADEYLFAVGQKLKILVGPHAGLPAVVSVSTKTRIEVLLSLFGRTSSLSINAASWTKMVERTE